MSKNIWIDHCSFNDGDQPDELNETYFGREFQHHDGLLDIKSSRILLRYPTAYFQDILKTRLSDQATATKQTTVI